jgi:hypothetical protein
MQIKGPIRIGVSNTWNISVYARNRLSDIPCRAVNFWPPGEILAVENRVSCVDRIQPDVGTGSQVRPSEPGFQAREWRQLDNP